MKTLVIGANGKIGRLFCQSASCDVVAMVRDAKQHPFFRDIGVESVEGDLEGEFSHAFEGCQRVVFTAGSGGHTGGDKTLLIDLYGALRAIEESERRSILHFVMVSAMRVDRPLATPAGMRHYFVAKKLADDRLKASSVPYTILRPGRLTDAPASGAVRSDPTQPGASDISRANVARCIDAALRDDRAKGRILDLLDGDVPIDRLFAN